MRIDTFEATAILAGALASIVATAGCGGGEMGTTGDDAETAAEQAGDDGSAGEPFPDAPADVPADPADDGQDAGLDGTADAPADVPADAPADPVVEETPAPECIGDGDCGGTRRCFHGICRDRCIIGWCPGGRVCQEGVCVDCRRTTECRGGGNELCDTSNFTCVPRPVTDPVIGAMYHHWWTVARWQGDRGNYVYEPVLGHYDNSTPSVVRQHNAWGARAGINTWVLDAWITDRDDGWMQRNTAAVLDGADADGMRYFFLVDGWFEFTGSDGGFDAHAIASRINAKLAPAFGRTGYLRAGGRPVLFFWASWGKPCAAFTAIRAGIEGTVGPIYMTGNNGDASCWDRVMEYNPYTGEETTHAGQIARQGRLFGGWEEDGFPWAPTTMAGYNDTHVREGNPPIALDAGFFADSIRTALRFNQFENHWLFVCSWSEWHEGSNIEPSSDFADPPVFLDTMRRELAAAGWVH